MKAEKVLGFAVCAFACTMGSAFANETNGWFGVTADTAINTYNCSTSGVATVSDSKIVLDNDMSSPFVVSNFTAASTSDGIVKLTATARLTPSSTNDFTEVSADAKAGFAVGIDGYNNTNFYGYANGAWHKLTGTVAGVGEDTTFSLLLNYRDGKVSFFQGDGILLDESSTTEFDLEGADALNGINAYGNGSITSITGGYEVAVAAYGGKKYGSVADAKVAGGTGSDIKKVNDTGAVIDKTTADNGLSVAVCMALGLDIDSSTANIAVAPVDTDTAPDAITLKINVDSAPEASAVRYAVQESKAASPTYYDKPDQVQIPLEAGTYTITPVLK